MQSVAVFSDETAPWPVSDLLFPYQHFLASEYPPSENGWATLGSGIELLLRQGSESMCHISENPRLLPGNIWLLFGVLACPN